MKKTALLLFICASSLATLAQTTAAQTSTQPPLVAKLPPLDKSPLDMAYFPVDYPMIKTQNKTTQQPLARVIYSRPQRDNRTIFGELIEYGKVWRLGANEATEIEFFKDAYVGGKKVLKGRYTLYAIPQETKWTLIINRDTDTWGAFVYDPKKRCAPDRCACSEIASTGGTAQHHLRQNGQGREPGHRMGSAGGECAGGNQVMMCGYERDMRICRYADVRM